MSIKLHPRVEIYQRARNDIDAAVSEALGKNPDLTYFALMGTLVSIAGSEHPESISDRNIAETAYGLADAMLEARKK